MDTLKPIWYTDAELLINDLITDSIPQLNNKYTNKNNQSFEYIKTYFKSIEISASSIDDFRK